jgi:hypothetical protein
VQRIVAVQNGLPADASDAPVPYLLA